MSALSEHEYREIRIEAAQRLAILLRHFRQARGLSQERVAQEAGLALYTYSCLERATTPSGRVANPTLDTLIRVLHALEVPEVRLDWVIEPADGIDAA